MRIRVTLLLVPVLGTLICVAVLLLGAVTLPRQPVAGAIMTVIAAAALATLLLVAATLDGAHPHPLAGAELNRAVHTKLWARVTAAAEDLGVPVPVRIVVDGAARVALARRHTGNELVIGLPLLLGLTEPQLSAMLIHELAHDAAPGGVIHRRGERIDATMRQLNVDRRWSHRPARVVMRQYAALYRRLATAANERHELRADDRAAELTSPKITAEAIARTELIRERWRLLVTEYVPLSAAARRRGSLSDGLRTLLAVPVPATAPAPEPGGSVVPPSYDTHPSLRERATRLSRVSGRTSGRTSPAHDETREGAPATSLLAGGQADISALERAVLPDDDPEADWETIAQLAAQAQAAERTGHLAWAMRESFGDRPVTLAAVLAVIADRQGGQIVTPLLPPGLAATQRPAAAQRLLEELLTAFVITALLSGGRARHEVAWPGGTRLMRRSDHGWIPWDGEPPIRSGIANPAGTSALQRWLEEIGTDLSTVAHPSAGPPLHLLSFFSDVELELPFEKRPVDLLIYRTGVLLAAIQRPKLTSRLTQQATRTLRGQSPAMIAAQRIQSQAGQTGQRPQDLPGGWWIAADTLSGGEVRERGGGFEIQLRISGGTSASMRTSARTVTGGDALDDLQRLLP